MRKRQQGSNFQEGMLKLLQTLPKVLKYLPFDKAQDARNFMLSFQYWLGGSRENLENFSSADDWRDRYLPGMRGQLSLPSRSPTWRWAFGTPCAADVCAVWRSIWTWYNAREDLPQGREGSLWLLRGVGVAAHPPGDGGMMPTTWPWVQELESRGARVVPVFAGVL
jgi:magnesium chelatase subunit H